MLTMSNEVNQVIYNKIIQVANDANSIDAITMADVSSICMEEGSHMDNEQVTLAKLYIDIARCFITKDYDFPRENQNRLRLIASSLGIDDIVKTQYLHDIAFTQFYEECVENCLYSLNMTEELYNQLKSIQREYGISLRKATEIENNITNNFIKCMIIELREEGDEKSVNRFINDFAKKITFKLDESTLALLR